MDMTGRVAIVTGAGGGIGEALTEALVAAGARVVIADSKFEGIEAVANRLNAGVPDSVVAVAGDVSCTEVIAELIARAEHEFGPVDIYFANAGVGGGVTLDASEKDWDMAHQVNVMAHVRAAQLLIPGWTERGSGYFVSTASAAGLLTQIGSASYSVSKHGAVAFAEWLSITYGDQGVAVSCLCPMGVNTAMLTGGEPITNDTQRRAVRAVIDAGGVLEPREVADTVLAAMKTEEFLILPHPEVKVFAERKVGDIDRWIAGMRRYQASLA